MLDIGGFFYPSCIALLFCQNGSLVAIGDFGTEFVGKAAKQRTMAAEPRKMAPAVRTMATEINYVKPFS